VLCLHLEKRQPPGNARRSKRAGAGVDAVRGQPCKRLGGVEVIAIPQGAQGAHWPLNSLKTMNSAAIRKRISMAALAPDPLIKKISGSGVAPALAGDRSGCIIGKPLAVSAGDNGIF
jgi:hypothetical protein